ncbi:hypothetical protein BURKHO8Y_70204 [Burkholderia sp. 8Y]|nr:hypothetical protein BURKHO8Y_70204 [Burkholderia sp. 8Y]
MRGRRSQRSPLIPFLAQPSARAGEPRIFQTSGAYSAHLSNATGAPLALVVIKLIRR